MTKKVYPWQQVSYNGLDAEKVAGLIEACRIAHGDFISIGLACGIRAAFRTLHELNADRVRHEVVKVDISSNGCAAMAYSIICYVSPFKDQISFKLYSPPDWEATSYGTEKKCYIKMKSCSFSTVEQVFDAADEDIFDIVEVSDIE